MTAEGAAVMRAIHQTMDGEPKILDDPISPRLVDEQSAFYKSRLELIARLPGLTRLRLKAGFVMRSPLVREGDRDKNQSNLAEGLRVALQKSHETHFILIITALARIQR